ncbi:MinD/ParA family ATP-binding protein [Mycolicibacterium vaccae]|uniref:CobQ/CobB/MinD/ParA nucleotide binding domain-containing protein n=1 Tax=Mycolicibacterium vaccae ATCC 25954 TaxID=1194972 RepID=K0UXI0_MYCVA|nr:hypothetical protein MYVA_0068 [Mycolicibacterium vaccae 95051]EJZ11466.1 hypothetical protein MVAC_05467 [Mycolicibacterium vaccae ATCC 25954]
MVTDRDDGLREDPTDSDPVTEQTPVIVPPPVRPGEFSQQPTPPQPAPPRWPDGRPPQRSQGWVPHSPPPAPPALSFAPQPDPDAPWTAPQPATFAERIRPDELVPHRKTLPGSGWRRALYKASFGLINLGPSPEDKRMAALEAVIRGPLRGNFKIGVMGKGGVGKTTVSAAVGSVLAELRQDVRVVAIDADTAFGKLGSRVDPKAQGSFWELAGDQHLDTFADVRNRLGCNAAGLFVLAGEPTPARRRVLDPAIYREAVSRLDRHFTISVIDCSSTMDSPVTQEVLRDLDALVVVSSPWVDGAAAAGQTLDWLAARGMANLLQRTVVILNDSDGHADKRTRRILAQQFSAHGQHVIEVPFDGGLRPGGVIDGTGEMSPQTRRKFVELVAALAGFFPAGVTRSG